MTRLFVAVWPTDEVRAALADLDVPAEPGVRPVPPENWHITLRFLGDADADEVIARLAAAELPSTTVALGPAVERLGRNSLVVPAAGADELAALVADSTADIGQPVRHRFRGHLTVARTKSDAPSTAIGRPFVAEFAVREIALVASDLTPQGAVYTTRSRFGVRPQG
jgi:2'-5' RNA ligase